MNMILNTIIETTIIDIIAISETDLVYASGVIAVSETSYWV